MASVCPHVKGRPTASRTQAIWRKEILIQFTYTRKEKKQQQEKWKELFKYKRLVEISSPPADIWSEVVEGGRSVDKSQQSA
ncbi:uncharacterized [Tachysurus ichikawai]